MNGNSHTIAGNLGTDPELRFTANGNAVVALNVGVDERKRNAETGEWESAGTSWFRVIAWGNLAENIAQTFTRGMRVIVTGAMKQRAYETREGEKRYSWELTADDIGPSLRYATAEVRRASRERPGPDESDPWATEPAGTTAGPQSPPETASPAPAAEPAHAAEPAAEPGSGPRAAGSGRARKRTATAPVPAT